MSDCPSWTQLLNERNQRDIKRMEPTLRSDARRLGITNPDDPDLWALLKRLNDWRDEQRRPEVEARAKRVGVPVTETRRTGFLGRRKVEVPREVWRISLDAYHEEDRRRMCRELGYS